MFKLAIIIDEEPNFSVVNTAFIEEFEEKEEPQEVIRKAKVATLYPSDLGNSVRKVDSLFTKRNSMKRLSLGCYRTM